MNTRKLTMAEAWRFGGPVAIIALKLFGLSSGQAVAMDLDRVIPIGPEEFPAHVYRTFEPHLDTAKALGFDFKLAYRQPIPSGDEAFGVIFVENGEETTLSMLFFRKGDAVGSALSLLSFPTRGGQLEDCDQKKQLDKPPGVDMGYHPGASLNTLYGHHKARKKGLSVRRIPTGQAELLDHVVSENRDWIQWGLKRGLLVPI